MCFGELRNGSLEICKRVVWFKGDLTFRLETLHAGVLLLKEMFVSVVTNELSSSSNLSRPFFAFSSVQLYNILQVLVVIYFVFFQ